MSFGGTEKFRFGVSLFCFLTTISLELSLVAYTMDDTKLTLSFELFPGRTLTLMPYESVTNAGEVFDYLRVGKLPDTGFFNPRYVRLYLT